MRKLTKSKLRLIVIFIILLFVAIYVLSVGMRLVSVLCAEEIRAEIINMVNDSNDLVQKLNMFYEDYFTIHRNTEGKIDAITSNTALINQMNMIIQTEIQNRINSLRTVKLHMPAGAFTGNSLLSRFGFRIPVTAHVVSNCYTVLDSSFTVQGINQTLHRLQINCYVEMKINVPTRSYAEDVTNEILMAENIIVGEVPSTYLTPGSQDYLDLLP